MSNPRNDVVIRGATGSAAIDTTTPDAAGLIVTVNTTAYTSGHITVTISGIAADGSLTTLLVSASLGAAGVVRLQVGPGIAASSNVAAQAVVPGAIRIAAVSSTFVGTYNVSVATTTLGGVDDSDGNAFFAGTVTAGTVTDGTATVTGGVVTATEVTTATFDSTATDVGFFGATPVAQQTAPVALVTTSATQTTPWGFATEAQAEAIATKVNLLITALKNFGLIA